MAGAPRPMSRWIPVMSPKTRPHLLLAFAGLIAVAGLAIHMAHVGLGLGSSATGDELVDQWIYNALMGGAAGACVLRALLVRRDRAAWLLLGAGALAWFA